MERPMLEQPTRLVGTNLKVSIRPFTLCAQPSEIGIGDDAGRVSDSLRGTSNPGPQQPFGGEEGHLRVVGDRTQGSVGRRIVRDAL
jgi:hypothetical protein